MCKTIADIYGPIVYFIENIPFDIHVNQTCISIGTSLCGSTLQTGMLGGGELADGGGSGWPWVSVLGGTDLDTTEMHQHNDQSTQSRPKPEGGGRRGRPCYKP